MTTGHRNKDCGIHVYMPGTRAMKALRFDGTLSLAEMAKPIAGEGESLVRVALAGICRTDLEITRGYADFRGVLGHEFVGVAETGPLAGSRVVGEINVACGRCPMCRAGLRSHCERRTVLGIRERDGAMAQWLTLPHENLHAVPDEIGDRHAVFTEPLAAALEITQNTHVAPGERVVVVGDGKLGQLASQVLALTGAEVTVVGRHAEKLALARARGIGAIGEADSAQVRGADVVVDCAGTPGGFALAGSLVRPRGRIVLKSTLHGEQQVALAPLAVNEITVIGSRCGPFEAALRLLRRRLVDVEPLIAAVFPLSDGVAAFARAHERGVMKVLLETGH